MSRITGLSLAVLAVAGMAFMGGGKPKWYKYDQVIKAEIDTPRAAYATVDATGGGC